MTTCNLRIAFSLGLAAALCNPTTGQDPGEDRNPQAEVQVNTRPLPVNLLEASQNASGITLDGETFWGLGPAYKASFTNGGVEFTPALGESAPRNFPLRFTLQTIHRGNRILYDAATAAPALAMRDGDTIFYDRAGIREVYEVRADGIKQSFVFANRPAGAGELVVRGAIQTELPAMAHGRIPGGLSFRLDGLGGVRIGEVVGVDAMDRSGIGELRFDGETVEFTLPADMVDQATYPLALDPLISSEFLVGDTTARNLNPDVAFEETIDQYMVVWERVFSATDVDIRGSTIDAAGATVSSLIGLTVTSDVDQRPAVASTDQSNDFYVVWQRGTSVFGPWNIHGRNYDTSATAVGPEDILANSSSNEIDPDVGGDATTVDDRVTVVWEKQGSGIQAIWVDQQGSGASILGTVVDVTTDVDDHKPAISKSGGTTGRWIVAFENEFSPTDNDIFAVPLGRNTSILGGRFQVDFATADDRAPDVDGDGTVFMVAYQRVESGSPNDHDIYCRTIRTTGGPISAVTSRRAIADNPNDDQKQPAISFLGAKYLVAFADEISGLDYGIGLQALNPACQACEDYRFSNTGPVVDFRPKIASRYSGRANQTFTGSSDKDQAMFVIHSGSTVPPFDLEIRGRLFEAIGTGGAVASLWPGCGIGGTIGVNGPVAVGNSDFAFTLTGADPASLLYGLGLALPTPPINCGICMFVNGTYDFIVPSGAPGTARKGVNIPCLANLMGLPVDAQWVAFGTAVTPCPIAGTLSASNAIRVTLGF